MITESERNNYSKAILEPSTLKKLKELAWESRTGFERTEVRQEGNHLFIDLYYYRKIFDHKDNKKFTLNYKGDLVARVLDRPTEKFPFGIEVVKWQKHLLK